MLILNLTFWTGLYQTKRIESSCATKEIVLIFTISRMHFPAIVEQTFVKIWVNYYTNFSSNCNRRVMPSFWFYVQWLLMHKIFNIHKVHASIYPITEVFRRAQCVWTTGCPSAQNKSVASTSVPWLVIHLSAGSGIGCRYLKCFYCFLQPFNFFPHICTLIPWDCYSLFFFRCNSKFIS